MVNILHPMPKTCPSALYSMAEAATELANPVIGTRPPATSEFSDFGIKIKAGKDNADQYQNKGTPGTGSIFIKSETFGII